MIEDDPRAAERRLALAYVARKARMGVAALLALDATLGNILRTTREPIVGQMRLTWWHEALTALDGAPPPAEPVLVALAVHVVRAGVPGTRLATLAEAWEMLLDPLDRTVVDRAAERGAVLFAAMAALTDVTPTSIVAVASAGRGWAYADLSLHLSDPGLASHAREQARAALDGAMAPRWPSALRGMGAMVLLARDDVSDTPSPPGSWRRVTRLVGHRLTGL